MTLDSTPNFEILQAKWQDTPWREIANPLNLRLRRALSWLQRAEKETNDPDAAFVFHWIAFNAAYAKDAPMSERNIFDDYFDKIIRLDRDRTIYRAIWNKFSGPIRTLLNNPFVFHPFWEHHNRVPGYEDWKSRFEKSQKKSHRALATQNTKIILSTLFDRLYVLRNQLLHGGATWQSSVNRAQVRDGARITAFLVPHFINLMIDNPDDNWGTPCYPVVQN